MTQADPYECSPRLAANQLDILSEKLSEYLEPADIEEIKALSRRFFQHFADFDALLWDVHLYSQRSFRR